MNWMWYVVLAGVVVILWEILKQSRSPSAVSEAEAVLHDHWKVLPR